MSRKLKGQTIREFVREQIKSAPRTFRALGHSEDAGEVEYDGCCPCTAEGEPLGAFDNDDTCEQGDPVDWDEVLESFGKRRDIDKVFADMEETLDPDEKVTLPSLDEIFDPSEKEDILWWVEPLEGPGERCSDPCGHDSCSCREPSEKRSDDSGYRDRMSFSYPPFGKSEENAMAQQAREEARVIDIVREYRTLRPAVRRKLAFSVLSIIYDIEEEAGFPNGLMPNVVEDIALQVNPVYGPEREEPDPSMILQVWSPSHDDAIVFTVTPELVRKALGLSVPETRSRSNSEDTST